MATWSDQLAKGSEELGHYMGMLEDRAQDDHVGLPLPPRNRLRPSNRQCALHRLGPRAASAHAQGVPPVEAHASFKAPVPEPLQKWLFMVAETEDARGRSQSWQADHCVRHIVEV